MKEQVMKKFHIKVMNWTTMEVVEIDSFSASSEADAKRSFLSRAFSLGLLEYGNKYTVEVAENGGSVK